MDLQTYDNNELAPASLQALKRTAVPLHAEVAEVLRRQILSGALAAGTRLPALSTLTEQLGIARMTVVQAMNTLEEEGLIEKHSGRGTFVRQVEIQSRHTLHMQADLSQIHVMVEQLEVSSCQIEQETRPGEDGRAFRAMNRIHARLGRQFCQVDIQLDETIFQQAPDRFAREIVVAVIRDLGIVVSSARQTVTLAYADFALAQALGIKINSALFRVQREFRDEQGRLIYSAVLSYPGDQLELEMDFSTAPAAHTTTRTTKQRGDTP